MKTKDTGIIMQNKVFLWIALVIGLLLLIPLIGMQFYKDINWSIGDFIFAFIVLYGAGITFVLLARKAKNNTAYKVGVGIAVATALLLVWINAAVGIIGDDDSINFMYISVLFVGMIGAFISRLEPMGMAKTLFAMAITQMVVPVIALFTAPQVMMQSPGLLGIFVLNGFFSILFVVSGLLFRSARGKF